MSINVDSAHIHDGPEKSFLLQVVNLKLLTKWYMYLTVYIIWCTLCIYFEVFNTPTFHF